MTANLALYEDPERTFLMEDVNFGEVVAPVEFNDLLYGEPVRVYGKNAGNTGLRDLVLILTGDGSKNIQLAKDVDGEPGVWAAPGESLLVSEETVFAGENFEFWARAVYALDDSEGRKELNLVFQGLSVG